MHNPKPEYGLPEWAMIAAVGCVVALCLIGAGLDIHHAIVTGKLP